MLHIRCIYINRCMFMVTTKHEASYAKRKIVQIYSHIPYVVMVAPCLLLAVVSNY